MQSISDSDDPNLTERVDLVLNTASLASLGHMLRAPRRLINCARVLNTIIEGKEDRLIDYIGRKKDLNDQQKYFLAFAGFYRAEQRRKANLPLAANETQLMGKAESWYEEVKTKVRQIPNRDDVLEMAVRQYEAHKGNM